MTDPARQELTRMLAAAGLPAGEEDVEAQLSSTYPVMRAAVASLHGMREARAEVPALVFDADPGLESWHEGRPRESGEGR